MVSGKLFFCGGLLWLASTLSFAGVIDGDLLSRATLRSSSRPQRASSSSPDLKSNGDDRSIAIGETLVLGDFVGPGRITHLWCTVGSYDPFYPRSLVLRIYWDGAEKPSVEVPLGDFFGVGHGAQTDFVSLPVSTSSRGRSRNCFWQMPFGKRALVTVTNESEQYPTESFYYNLDWEQAPDLPADILYFHARYHQAHPPAQGDYTILETTGEGNYLGTVYSAHQMETGWFGEGDDRFTLDGEELPSLRGTGTEDYFGDAWGFRKFSTPFYGVSLWEGYYMGDRTTAYRWHLPDPIPFRKSLKLSIEHRGSILTDDWQKLASSSERSDWVSSVAFWYQTPPVALPHGLPPAKERIAPYRVIQAASLEVTANPEGTLQTEGPSVSFSHTGADGYVEFPFEIPEAGRYQISALLWFTENGGRFQPSLDGTPIGEELDTCDMGGDPDWVSFDLHDLTAGAHSLRFTCVGPSEKRRSLATPSTEFSMTYLILLRMQDMQGYRREHDRKMAEKMGE